MRRAWMGPSLAAGVVLGVACVSDETLLAKMYRAEDDGDLATAHGIAEQLVDGGVDEMIPAIRFFARQKDFAATASATERALRFTSSRPLRTQLLELRTQALLGLGRVDEAVDDGHRAVADFPEDPRRHLCLARSLETVDAVAALAEVREAMILLPIWDRAFPMTDSEGHLVSTRYYLEAMELYDATWKKAHASKAAAGADAGVSR